MKTRFLFPHVYRKVGWIILVPFILIGIPIVFWNFKFDFLDLKAFAFYSDMPFFWHPNLFRMDRNQPHGDHYRYRCDCWSCFGGLFQAKI